MNPRDVAEAWLALALSQLEPALPVYRHPAPETASTPFITVGLRSAVDLSPIGNTASIEKLTYDVSAWDEGLSSLRVNVIAKAIKQAILTAPLSTIEGGTVIGVRRLGAVAVASTVEEGKTFQRDGSVFELIIVAS